MSPPIIFQPKLEKIMFQKWIFLDHMMNRCWVKQMFISYSFMFTYVTNQSFYDLV